MEVGHLTHAMPVFTYVYIYLVCTPYGQVSLHAKIELSNFTNSRDIEKLPKLKVGHMTQSVYLFDLLLLLLDSTHCVQSTVQM